jgi:disulfide bond formation protein DsbB
MFATALKNWPIAALVASASMLAAAHGFELAGYQPCALCLKQREVYWVAMAVAAVAFAAPRVLKAPILPALGNAILALVFLTGMGVAVYHAGAEWKFWPGPTTCAAVSTTIDAKSMLEALDKPMHPPSCDEAAWTLFGISMAGYNAVISLGLAALSLAAASAVRPKARA